MNVLVTGAAGFIGSHLAEALIAAGHEVTAYDDLSGGFERNVPAGAHFVKGSILNAAKLSFICRQHKYGAVYHLAAYAAEGLSHFIRRFNYENNVVGSMNVINAAVESGVPKVIFTSSIAVYGHGEPPFSEGDSLNPADPYGIAKLAVERDLEAAFQMFGLDYTIFRPHNVIGPRQNIGDKYRNVAGIFMNQLLLGEPLTIFGDGKQTRAFTCVEDVVRPMVQALTLKETSRGTYNVGGDTAISVNDLASMIFEVSGITGRVTHLPLRKEVTHAYSSHSKLERVFGKHELVPLKTGLSEMWKWARDLGPQPATPLPCAIEVRKNLPPSWG